MKVIIDNQTYIISERKNQGNKPTLFMLRLTGKARQYVSRAAVRSPQGMQIKIGKDAIKTQGVFRNAARQVFEKDLADWLSTKFVQSNINEQVSIIDRKSVV